MSQHCLNKPVRHLHVALGEDKRNTLRPAQLSASHQFHLDVQDVYSFINHTVLSDCLY